MPNGMPNGTNPHADQSARPASLEGARVWLAGHGLADVRPTPLLARRLAVRWSARLAAHILLAAFIIAVALIYVSDRPGPADDGSGAYRRWSLLVLTAVVVGLVLAQASLDWWVRRVDRQAGAALRRRAAHPVRLGWRTVLGWPRAVFAVAMLAGATALAIGSLTVRNSVARYAGAVLLIALGGVAVGMAVQLRHVLTRPAVADDEASLTADVLMRVEDAREVATPTVVWCLPIVSVLGSGVGWLFVSWLVFVVLSVLALLLITVWTARGGTVARQATSAR